MAVAVAEFQQLLTGLADEAVSGIGKLLGRLDRLDLSEARAFLTDAYPELITPFLAAAADLTATWYEEQSGPVGYQAITPDLAPVEQLGTSARWALTQSGPVIALGGAGTRTIFATSRDTVITNVRRERVKWARHASPNACGFCRLLATRGPVYWSQEAAQKAHDYCHCIGVPDRDGSYQPAPYVAEWKRDYKAAVKGGAKTVGEIAQAMDRRRVRPTKSAPAPATAGGGGGGDDGGRIPPNRFASGGMDLPDEYPELPDGSKVPFTPADRPTPTTKDRDRVLDKHRHGADQPNKTMFPADWSDDDIMAAVDLTTADPAAGLHRAGDKLIFERVVDGELVRVQIRLDLDPPVFWNAYPPNGTMPS